MLTEYFRRWMPLGVATLITVLLQYRLLNKLLASRWAQPVWRRRLAWSCFGISCLLLAGGVAAAVNRLAAYIPARSGTWLHATALVWMVLTVSLSLLVEMKAAAPLNTGRRRFVRAGLGAAATAPLAAAGYGVFVERLQVRLEEVNVPVAGLPKDLDGLQIGQISDIHLGPFLARKELDRAVAQINEAKPQVTVITGDLISRQGDPLDECLESLARLKADAGLFACMGNHERYARAETYAAQKGSQRGIRFLRREAAALEFGHAILNLAGVDYQPMRREKPAYLRRMRRLAVPGALNVLLSHNPDVFPRSIEEGYGLTLAGHTHGGQVNCEILNQDWNVARFYTPYTAGLYQQDGGAIYVNRGIGTIGVPVRIGARPEVTVIRLCAV